MGPLALGLAFCLAGSPCCRSPVAAAVAAAAAETTTTIFQRAPNPAPPSLGTNEPRGRLDCKRDLSPPTPIHAFWSLHIIPSQSFVRRALHFASSLKDIVIHDVLRKPPHCSAECINEPLLQTNDATDVHTHERHRNCRSHKSTMMMPWCTFIQLGLRNSHLCLPFPPVNFVNIFSNSVRNSGSLPPPPSAVLCRRCQRQHLPPPLLVLVLRPHAHNQPTNGTCSHHDDAEGRGRPGCLWLRWRYPPRNEATGRRPESRPIES